MKQTLINISTAILSTVVALAWAGPLHAAGRNDFNDYMDITRQVGSPSGVTCICVEDGVYAWIGTPEGLIRYDGRAVRKYTSREVSGHSLPDDEICQVLQDSLRNVWVMTSGGAALYRPRTDDFYVPSLGFEIPGFGAAGEEIRVSGPGNDLSDVRSACLVPGGVLFGGTDAVYRYSYSDGRVSLYARIGGVAERQFSVEKIVPWHDGTVLLFNRWLGIVALDPPLGGASRISRPLSCGNGNLALLVDSEGRVWVSPYNRGIECYDA
ncbi:MAG: hypothetical protein LUC24_01995, partial [Bacteroidales bacterium]|nr:hypothetical protein [Bacteroidales bacterium]